MLVRGRLSVVLTAMIVAAQLVGTTRADGPLTLDEIASLREQKQNPGQIIRVVKERGRGFPIDGATRKRLQELGFAAPAIAEIAKAKEVAAPDPALAVAAAAAPARENDPRVERIDRIVKEAVAKAGVPLTASEGERGRVFSGPGVPPQFAADARQVEGQLVATFPRSFVAGIDKRAVNVVIMANRSDYVQLLEALTRAGESNGVQYTNEDGRSLVQLGVDKPALYLQGLTTMCLEGATPDHARRTVAHAVGYHALTQASSDRAGDALAQGFGNVTEVMLVKSPGTTVAGGYSDREIGGAGGWPELVRQRFAEQRIRGLGRTLAGNFSTMEMPDYAEAWSLTDLLCAAPDKFAAAVAAMRSGAEPLKAIVDAYGMDEAAITGKWQQWAATR